MHINQNVDIVLEGRVKHPLYFFFMAVHTANVWSVWIHGPVTNWNTNSPDLLLLHLNEVSLSVPGIDVSSDPPVGVVGIIHLGTSPMEHLAESISIEGNISFLMVKERIEE